MEFNFNNNKSENGVKQKAVKPNRITIIWTHIIGDTHSQRGETNCDAENGKSVFGAKIWALHTNNKAKQTKIGVQNIMAKRKITDHP